MTIDLSRPIPEILTALDARVSAAESGAPAAGAALLLGDSIGSGYPSNTPPLAKLGYPSSVVVTNASVPGIMANSLYSKAQNGDYDGYRSTSGPSICIIQAGVNDLGHNNNTTGAQLYQTTSALAALMKAKGWYVLLCTLLPVQLYNSGIAWTPEVEQQRQNYNSLVRANGAAADGTIDFAANATIGDAANVTGNPTWYPDGLHPSQAGDDALVSQYRAGTDALMHSPVRVPSDGSPAPVLSLSSAVTHPEGNSGTTEFVWTLTLARDGSTAAYPFSWSVAGNSANPADAADFGGSFPSGSGTFASAETTKTITVLVAGDTATEPDETFLLTVVASSLNTVTSTGTISNDDGAAPPSGVSLALLAGNTTGALLLNNNRTFKGNNTVPSEPRAGAIVTTPIAGKMLFAATLDAIATNGQDRFAFIGISTTRVTSAGTGFDPDSAALFTGLGQVFAAGAGGPMIPTPVVGDAQAVFVNFDTGRMWLTKSGIDWYGSNGPLTIAQVNAGTSGIDISTAKLQGTLYFALGERDQTGFQWTAMQAWPFGANTRPTAATYIGES